MDAHVRLRLTTPADLDRLVAIKMDSSLWEYEDFIPTDAVALRAKLQRRMDGGVFRQYFILSDDGTVVGELHAHPYVPERKSWEIGYAVFPEHRRRGYCLAAVRIALEDAFEKDGAHKVVAMCNAHNAGSAGVLEKAGMTREGVFRKELPWRGTWADQWFYCILDDEYAEAAANR